MFHFVTGLLAAGILLTAASRTDAVITNHIMFTVPQQFSTIAAAVDAANRDTNYADYYTIIVKPATYTNDFPTVNRPMTIEADLSVGGQAVMNATEPLPNQKGIILSNANLTVIGIKFTGAMIDNSLGGNGAGIRDQNMASNARLVVIDDIFESNQTGILTGANPNQVVQIYWSKFRNNGNPDQNWWQHGIYIGRGKSLTVTNSLFCGQLIGHDIKSRAASTTVQQTQILDGQPDATQGCNPGSSSYAIDTPNGGQVTINGDTIVQGPWTQNYSIIAYGEEAIPYATNSMAVANNSITSHSSVDSIGIYIPNCPVHVQQSNNVFEGVTTPVFPPACAQ